MKTNDEYFKQGSAERIVENQKTVMELVTSFPEPRRSAVKKMLEGPLGEQYFMAPASGKRAYHYAFPGGLAAHSIGVVQNAVAIAGAIAAGRWPTEKLIFLGLFHDLAKAVSYRVTKEDWKWRRGEFYEMVDEERMLSGDGSLYLLQREGVVLDYEETVAIRLTDGPQEFHLFREPALALVVAWADRWTMTEEKERDR